MRILFGAQGSVLRVFHELDQRLRTTGVITGSAYWISDSRFYFENRDHLPLLSDPNVPQLYEWDFTSQPVKTPWDQKEWLSLNERYKRENLWNAIICDRRLMHGRLCKVRQSYRGHFDHDELRLIIYRSLNALDGLIAQFRPHAIVSFVPATFGDYLLYLASKGWGIRYLQLRSTKVQNFVTFADGIAARSSVIDRRYRTNRTMRSGYEFEDKASTYLKDGQAMSMVYEGTVSRRAVPITTTVARGLRGVAGVLRRTLRPRSPIVARDNHVPPALGTYYYDVVVKAFSAARARWMMRHRERKPGEAKADPFAFYPLHSEPEIALSVNGRDHQNQIETVRRLAQSIPLTWKLVVKEHPQNLGYRSTGYYRRMLEIPNVCFADPDTSPHHWIQEARAVITVSGFVGFEALMLRKPVIVLGDVAYAALPTAMLRQVHNMSEVADQLADLLVSYQYNGEALRAFIAAVMAESVPVNLYSQLLGKRGRTAQMSGSESEQYAALAAHLESRLIAAPESHAPASLTRSMDRAG